MNTRAVKQISARITPCEDVLSYQHFGLIERLQEKEKLSLEDAQQLFQDMLRFLTLCDQRDEQGKGLPFLAPPEAIDVAWHHFILFTEDYAVFCTQYFGRFIHHRPATSRDVMPGNLAVKTHALARKLYGDLSKNWSCSLTAKCSPSTNCQQPPPFDCALIRQ